MDVGPSSEVAVGGLGAAVEGDAQDRLGKLGDAVRKVGRIHTLLLDHLASFLQNLRYVKPMADHFIWCMARQSG